MSRGYPENATFAAVLQQFAMESQQENLYFLCSQDGMLAIARATDDIANLSLKDRAAICTAPVDERNKPVFNAFLIFIERLVSPMLPVLHTLSLYILPAPMMGLNLHVDFDALCPVVMANPSFWADCYLQGSRVVSIYVWQTDPQCRHKVKGTVSTHGSDHVYVIRWTDMSHRSWPQETSPMQVCRIRNGAPGYESARKPTKQHS